MADRIEYSRRHQRNVMRFTLREIIKEGPESNLALLRLAAHLVESNVLHTRSITALSAAIISGRIRRSNYVARLSATRKSILSESDMSHLIKKSK